MSSPSTAPFVRDRFTLLAYAMLAYFAYMQAALGPLMPFLREEFKLSYTVGGLHISAFALGMVLAGATGDTLARRWGRRRVFWGGGGMMAGGALLFILGRHAALTIAGALIMGYPGSLLLIMVQATLSDHHRERRAIALTESNIAASVSAGLAPLLVGGLQWVGVGWRGAPLLAVLVWAGLAFSFRGEAIPHGAQAGTSRPGGRLPLTYWVYWLVVFFSVSVEWCIVFWGADFLTGYVGLSKVNASTLMSVFFVAVVIGRTGGSRLARSMPIGRLLLVAVIITIIGFFPFWLSPYALVNVAGLFVAGLGVANLFPLTLSAASSAVLPDQSDTASGRIALSAGLAILITPQALGSLADQIGIQNAYGIAAAFLAMAAAAILFVARRAARASWDATNLRL